MFHIQCDNYLLIKSFRHDLVPIVMGARPQDYERAAPYKSYIHVDDFEGPKELAEYLKKLEENDDLYNEYFRWKVIYFQYFQFVFPSYLCEM